MHLFVAPQVTKKSNGCYGAKMAKRLKFNSNTNK